VKLPVDALYDGGNKKGLIEFWEDENVNDIICQLAKTSLTETDGYELTAKKLVLGLQDVLMGKLNARESALVNAPPFDTYTALADTEMDGFGRLALMAYAHYLLGHVQATAAITNDKEFMYAMESRDKDTNLYKYTVPEYVVGATGASPYNVPGTSTDANLAARLVDALIKANSDATGNPTTSKVASVAAKSALVANIVKQVLGQDANRAVGEDNSHYSPEKHGLLKFFPDDVIYVNINLRSPEVSFGLGGPKGQKVTADAIRTRYADDISYTIKITLGPKKATLGATGTTGATGPSGQ
jgi:hypothetical protein